MGSEFSGPGKGLPSCSEKGLVCDLFWTHSILRINDKHKTKTSVYYVFMHARKFVRACLLMWLRTYFNTEIHKSEHDFTYFHVKQDFWKEKGRVTREIDERVCKRTPRKRICCARQCTWAMQPHLSRGRSHEKNIRQPRKSRLLNLHDTVFDCDKNYEAFLKVHGWSGRRGSGWCTSSTWPKFIPDWRQALQELDALVTKEDLQSWKSTSTKPSVVIWAVGGRECWGRGWWKLITVLGEISMLSSALASERGWTDVSEESWEEEEAAETVESEGGEEEDEDEANSSGWERAVGSVICKCSGADWVGGEEEEEGSRRCRRIGVRGILLRASRRRWARWHSHSMSLSCNNWLLMLVVIQQLPFLLSTLGLYFFFVGREKMKFVSKFIRFFDNFLHRLVGPFLGVCGVSRASWQLFSEIKPIQHLRNKSFPFLKNTSTTVLWW